MSIASVLYIKLFTIWDCLTSLIVSTTWRINFAIAQEKNSSGDKLQRVFYLVKVTPCLRGCPPEKKNIYKRCFQGNPHQLYIYIYQMYIR